MQKYMHTIAAISNANAVAYNAIFALSFIGIIQLVSMSVLDKYTNVKVIHPSTISVLNMCLPFSFLFVWLLWKCHVYARQKDFYAIFRESWVAAKMLQKCL